MGFTVDYRETVVNRIKRDPAFAKALLDEATELLLTGEAEAARIVLRDLTHGLLGFERLAEITGTPSKSLHRMLSTRGNPGMDALSAIFSQLTKATFRSKPTVHVDGKLKAA